MINQAVLKQTLLMQTGIKAKAARINKGSMRGTVRFIINNTEPAIKSFVDGEEYGESKGKQLKGLKLEFFHVYDNVSYFIFDKQELFVN